jgi:hypothetical protein
MAALAGSGILARPLGDIELHTGDGGLGWATYAMKEAGFCLDTAAACTVCGPTVHGLTHVGRKAQLCENAR